MRQWGIDTAFPLIPYDSQKLCASDLSIFHPASSSCIVRNCDFVHFLLTQFCHSSFDCAMHLPRASPQSNSSTITSIWIPALINLMERENVQFFSFLTENILCCTGKKMKSCHVTFIRVIVTLNCVSGHNFYPLGELTWRDFTFSPLVHNYTIHHSIYLYHQFVTYSQLWKIIFYEGAKRDESFMDKGDKGGEG